MQVCRATFGIAIEIARALALLVLRLKRLVQASRLFEGSTASNVRRRIARITRVLVRFIDFGIGSHLNGTILRMQNGHGVSSDECPAAVIGRTRYIVISLLVWVGELAKHISLYRSVFHHIFEDCISYFTRDIYIVADFLKHVLVNLKFLVVNRWLSCVHQNFDFLPVGLDCSEVCGEGRDNFFAQFSRHQFLYSLVFLRDVLKNWCIAEHLLFGVLCLAQVFLDDTLLFHALAPLLFLSILVPEAVEQNILDLAARIVFPNHVQVLLRLVPRYRFHIVNRQSLNDSLERAHILDWIEWVV